jgi:Suppressor of fused protein (SUFU)
VRLEKRKLEVQVDVHDREPFVAESAVAFDVRRSMLLSRFILAWGQPMYRRVVSRTINEKFEIWFFPDQCKGGVVRFVTVGASALKTHLGVRHTLEYLLTLTPNLGGATDDAVCSHLADIVVHGTTVALSDELPKVFDVKIGLPPQWRQTALLIDEPLGEPEALESLSVGEDVVSLAWVVPLFDSEYKFILKNGVDAFDDIYNASGVSFVDATRPPIL